MTDPLVARVAAETQVSAAGSVTSAGTSHMNPDVLSKAVDILQDLADNPNLEEFSVLADLHPNLDAFGVTDESAKDPSQTSMGKALANHLVGFHTVMDKQITALISELTTVAEALRSSVKGWQDADTRNQQSADNYDKVTKGVGLP